MSRRAMLFGSVLMGTGAAAYLLLRPNNRSFQAPPAHRAVSLQLTGPITARHAGDIAASTDRRDFEISLRPGAINIAPIGEVVSGRATFGIISAIQFMVARGKGAPIIAFGAEFLDSPIAVFALDATKINSPTDFRGARIPRLQGSEAAIIYDAILANRGISRSDIREVENRGDIAMLIDRSIDVLPGDIGVTSYRLMKAGASYTVVRPGDYGIHVPGSVYFGNERTLRDHPSIVGAFLGQVISGWRKVYSGNSAIVDLIASMARVPRDQAEFELRAWRDLVLPVERRIAEFDELQWKQLRIILFQERLIKEDAEFSNAIDYSILQDVYRRPLSFGR